MARVSDAIKYFIRKKIKEDPLWRNLKVVFSGHEIPGEGEHKIMQHIREMKSQPDYQPNTRHCMYGQDADLIMLGLVSHEPHFTLLREIVDFNMGIQNKNSLKTVKKFTKESDFQLLHLSILREYLDFEFGNDLSSEQKVQSGYDLERIIDDFVFMTFLVGNDFLPHLPSLDIGDGAFDLLFDTYREQRLNWGKGQYLVYLGEVCDAARLEAFVTVIGAAETEILTKREDEEAEYRKKKRNWDKRDGVQSSVLTEEQVEEEEAGKQHDFLTMLDVVVKKHEDGGVRFVDGWSPPQLLVGKNGELTREKDFKGRYYFEKLHFTPIDVKDHFALRKAYVEGLMWCLAYYYKGCISWGWFFPYHYGPMLSDLINLPTMMSEINFELGKPLLPFEQLMGCLPPASAALVPSSYRKLMTSPDSPIKHFYPVDFKIDMNGKKNPWEGVNLLPFIDVALLKETIEQFCPPKTITADERARNAFGNVYLYTHDLTAKETIPSFNRVLGFTDISLCNSRVQVLHEPDRIDIPFKPLLAPGTTIPSPGYPSLNVFPIASVERLKAGLNCFGSQSKYPNTILNLHQIPQLPTAENLAPQVLGKNVFINYPMMHEAKVVAVCDHTSEVRVVKKKKQVRALTKKEAENWENESTMMQKNYLSGSGVPGTGGVNIGEIQIRLRVKPLQGMNVSPADGSSKKVFGKEEADVPIQMALWAAPAPDPRFVERGPLELKDLYPPQCRVLLTKGKYKGCIGTVLGFPEESDKTGEKAVIAKVEIIPPEPPFGLAIARSVQESFLSGSDAAQVLKISPQVLGRIMGSLHVEPGRYDLGLNLRYKQDFYVIGYTRKVDVADPNQKKKDSGNAWLVGDSVRVCGSRSGSGQSSDSGDEAGKSYWEYTPKAIRLLAAYKSQFPVLFAALAKYPNEKKIDAVQLFGPNGAKMLPKVREWLDSIETAKMPRTPTSTTAMPLTAIAAVQRAAEVRMAALQQAGPLKESILKLPTEALYREGSRSATDVVTPSLSSGAPQLGDRIVNMCANGVPFGARGTVVSVHKALHGCVEVVMDEEFIGGSNLQGFCKNFRGKLLVWSHVLKVVAADSAALVDNLVPKKKSKQASQQRQEVTPNHTLESIPRDSNYVTALSPIVANKHAEEKAARPPSETPTARPNGMQGRSKTSTERAKTPPDRSKTPTKKQGAWKEAKRPTNGAKGFKGANRGGKSGYAAWRAFVKKNLAEDASPANLTPALGQNNASAGLKALLGVKMSPTSKTPESSVSNNDDHAAAILKTVDDAAANLKAVLGVTPQSAPYITEQNDTTPASAADAFMKLVINENLPPPNNTASQPSVETPKFNFTYVPERQGIITHTPDSSQSIQHSRNLFPYPSVMSPNMVMPYHMVGAPGAPMMMYSGSHTPMLYHPHTGAYIQQQAMHSSISTHVPREKKGKGLHSTKIETTSAIRKSQIVPSIVASKGSKK